MVKKFIVLLTAVISIFMVACDNVSTTTKKFDFDDVKIWTASSAEKIRKEDISYALKGDEKLSFNCVKGETESVQLMLTPKIDINSYKLTARALSDGNGNEIPANAFEVYAESYFTITQRSNNSTLYPAGQYPDALIPMDFSVKENENTIKANENQGIWVLVDIPQDLTAGNYSGSFKLEVNGSSKDIPVNVQVYNVAMPKKATMGTVFLNRRNNIQMGEHDGTTDIMVRYFEQMLNYRIMLCDVPVYSRDPIEFAEFIDKHFDHPYFNTYILPFRHAEGKSDIIGQYPSIDIDFLKEHLKALANKSTNERNLVKDAMLYLYSITDEPEMNGGEYIVCEIQKDIHKAIDNTIKDLLRQDPNYFDDKQEVKQSILKLRNIITGGVESEIMQGSVNTYCPMIQLFHTEEQRKNINDVCTKYGCEQIWWYTCIAPRNPYCTYHIDDNLLGSRILSWMQADYGIQGNLYFDISSYGVSSKYDNQMILPCNQYKDPLRWDNPQAVNGDGYLVYPGSKYDYYGFIPSIRLMSIRDGMEEFELLKKLEKDYGALSEFYDTNIDCHKILKGMYQKLYTGTIPITDTQVFNGVRAELINNLEEVSGDNKFLIQDIKTIGNATSIEMLLSKDYKLKVNGQLLNEGVVCGQGYKYDYKIDTTQGDNYLNIEIIDKNDATKVTKISKYLSGKTVLLNDFNTQPQAVVVSQHSSVQLVQDNSIEGKCLKVNIKSIIKNDEAFNQLFIPNLLIKKLDFSQDIDFELLQTIEFDIKNEDAIDFTLKVALTSGKQSHNVGTYVISTGEYNHVRVDMNNVSWSKLKEVDGIKLIVENAGSVDAPKEYNFYLDNMYATYKRGK